MTIYPEALPHGTFEPVFDDLFFLRGQIAIANPERVIRTTRAMTVVRDKGALTLINSIRLNEPGLAALDRLGNVTSIVRVGGNHGRDDAFYADRYNVPVWAPDGVAFSIEPSRVETLSETSHPLHAADVTLLETTRVPEAVVRLCAHGGILVTGDCFQNKAEPDEFVDAPSREFLSGLGFFRQGNVGPLWRKNNLPKVSDFERILAQDFQHLLPGHGSPLLYNAKDVLTRSVEELRDQLV